MPLKAIEPDGVDLLGRNTGISIDAIPPLSLPVVTSPVQLAVLFLLYRDEPLKGVDRPPPSGTVVLLPGWLSQAGPDAEGLALLHGKGLCFVPRGMAAPLLRKIVPTQLDLPISEAFLLEQLTRLPLEGLEQVLSSVAQLPGGLCARTADITAAPRGRGAQKLRLRTAGVLLEIPITPVDFEALRTLFPWTADSGVQTP